MADVTDATADLRPLASTYRLQLHSGFTFDDAAKIVPYLAELGVTHLYLSPILTAVPGSQHGYDVVDHSQINRELGGREGLLRLSDAAHQYGLGIIVDVVPNHMALVPPMWHNAPVWEVLSEGKNSAKAHWFDVDWDYLDDEFGLPVLGAPLGEVLANGEITLDIGGPDDGLAEGRPVARYYDHIFPIAEGSVGDDLGSANVEKVLAKQHYHLASWKEADEVLNYRRFFEVDQLIAVQVELPDVFEATHRVLLDLHHAGAIDGFRIDHPDGLADPAGYLEMLADHLKPGAPVWVEKILDRNETLPTTWKSAGTTGYDANAALSLALVDPHSAEEVARCWAWVGGTPDFDDVIEMAKVEAVEELLQPEVKRLHRLAIQVLPKQDKDELKVAMAAILASFEVYRAYVRPGHEEPSPDAMSHLDDAVRRAKRASEGVDETIDALAEVLANPDAGVADPSAAYELAVRFQQTTGPVLAKGVEDTAFYRWHRMVALNEVGGHPSRGAHPSTQPLVEWAENQAMHWPQGMTALSTHDTKRSEDVRARLLAISGDEEAWGACIRAAVEMATQVWLSASAADLVTQTLLGVGEISEERLDAYLTKAMREAKLNTNWVEPDTEYEGAVIGLAHEAQTSGELHDAIEEAIAGSEQQIRSMILGQKLLQLTLPGVADTYQGTELVDLSLVDPDNRRPVNYRRRIEALARLDGGAAPADLSEEKLLVTARTLRLRASRFEVFGPDGSYRALKGSEHVVGHVRGEQVAALAIRDPHFVAEHGFENHHVDLPAGVWVDELTGRRVEVGEPGLPVDEAFAVAPVALLVKEA